MKIANAATSRRRKGAGFALALLLVLLTVTTLHPGSSPAPSPRRAAAPAPAEAVESRAAHLLGGLPLVFEANEGQTDGDVKFLARGDGYTFFLTGDGAVMALIGPESVESDRGAGANVLRLDLVGASRQATCSGVEEIPAKTNYLVGADAKKWRRAVRSFAQVEYKGVYDGVDLVYYGRQRQLEYDFNVAPGADPRTIQLSFAGAESVAVDGQGDLVLGTAAGDVRQHKPFAYQVVSGARREVACEYRLSDVAGEGASESTPLVTFAVGAYDRGVPLVIDPVVTYSTLLGGSKSDYGIAVAVDAAGNAYLTGETRSLDFPTSIGAYQTSFNVSEAFVAKFSPDGKLVYCTLLGGPGQDSSDGIAVDPAGNVYVAGSTWGAGFPTKNAIQPQTAGGNGPDAFLAKLNAAGDGLIFSTYWGGTDWDFFYGSGLALDAAGNVYLSGETKSVDFPTKNPAQPQYGGGVSDAFLTAFSADGSQVIYSTYFGGTKRDAVVGTLLAVDPQGNAFVSGNTTSVDLQTTPGAYQTANKGGTEGDIFVAKFDPQGAKIYATYLGGTSFERAECIIPGGGGEVYVSGSTGSTDFPIVNPLQAQINGDSDCFISKLDATGSALLYSTFYGGGGYESDVNVALDDEGNLYVAGVTSSPDLKVVNPIQATYGGGDNDMFMIRVLAGGKAIDFCSYFGSPSQLELNAMTLDADRHMYLVGSALAKFPTVNAHQPDSAGSNEAYVVKVGLKDLLSPPSNSVPQIGNVAIVGKQLVVTGVNFGAPSEIYVNSEKQNKVFNDTTEPTLKVMARKAGRWIAPGQTVVIQVRNAAGKMSDEYFYTRPL